MATSSGSTTPTVGAAKTMSAPTTTIGDPSPMGFILVEDEDDSKEPEQEPEAETADKQIPAIQPDTDPRRAGIWIKRIKEELDDASDLMKALVLIDPEQKIQRIRKVRKITQLNLKEAKLVVDEVNDVVPTISRDALETALVVAKQRDDLAKGLEEAHGQLHFHREDLKEEIYEELKEDLQKRLQKKLSQFNTLRNHLKTAETKLKTAEAIIAERDGEIANLVSDLDTMTDAFEEETENVEKATKQIEDIQASLDEEEHKVDEFFQAWDVIAHHYRAFMPVNRVFSNLLRMLGEMLGADVREY